MSGRNKNNSGFTLVELLVVISIIGLLSSLFLASFRNARIQASNARKVQDLNQIQKAVELYYADHSSYPPIPSGSISTSSSGTNTDWVAFQLALSPYMIVPVNTSNDFFYLIYYNNMPYTWCLNPIAGHTINVPRDGYALFAMIKSPARNFETDPNSGYYELFGGNDRYSTTCPIP